MKNMSKELDTTEYISELKALADAGNEVNTVVSGSSMLPFLVHNRDRVFFKKPDRKLRRGDIVFFRRFGGRYIMHRIYKIGSLGYYLVGDAQTVVEGPVKRDQIFGLITAVERNGRMLRPHSLTWLWYSKIWPILMPLRPAFMKMYMLFHKNAAEE